MNYVRSSEGANRCSYAVDELYLQFVGSSLVGVQSHIGVYALAFDVVGVSDDGSFSNGSVFYKRGFNFGRAQSMSRNVDNIVYSTGDPIVAFAISPTSI